MTLNEAVLKSLKDIGNKTNYIEVYHHIVKNGYYDFGKSRTPLNTVSSTLGDFIRNNDVRIGRIIENNKKYSYYLVSNELDINYDNESVSLDTTTIVNKNSRSKDNYNERDLHKLFSTYLNSINIKCKTIYHEHSTKEDKSQVWTNPDIVGIKFKNFKNNISNKFIRTVNINDTYEMYSYELKREIKNDRELKEYYFQALSNSGWAHYGYLVVFDFSDNLKDEMERLNRNFGIGIIKLDSNPYNSRIIYHSDKRNLDINAIDKLTNNNPDFSDFIKHTEMILSSDISHDEILKNSFNSICDDYFTQDDEIKSYCKEKNIPLCNFNDDIIEDVIIEKTLAKKN